MQVLVRARVGLYEPRGEYQLHRRAPRGGRRRRAPRRFEELKPKLAAEGLFDAARKRALPAVAAPDRRRHLADRRGASRTSCNVLRRRFPAIAVLIYPVPVQGAGAAREIVATLELADRRARGATC